jgi:hypothetical protein
VPRDQKIPRRNPTESVTSYTDLCSRCGRSRKFNNLNIQVTYGDGIPKATGGRAIPPSEIAGASASSLPTGKTSVNGTLATPWSAWSARSAWPGHPAILPPLPRVAKSEALATDLLSTGSTGASSNSSRHREQLHGLETPELTQAYSVSKKPNVVHGAREIHHRNTSSEHKLFSRAARAPLATSGSTSAGVVRSQHPEQRQWPYC